MKPAMTPQQAELSDPEKSVLNKYRRLAVGNASWPAFFYYEVCTTFVSGLSGMAGFGLRRLLYPALFARSGGKSAFGRGVLIRRPRQISIGCNCLFDDYSALDVREDDASLLIGDHVSVGRFTTIAAKGGHIHLADGANIGSYCRVATQTRVEIGRSVLIAAYTYIGPGNHQSADGQVPMIAREMEKKGGVRIGDHAWLGSHVTVLDGVTIGVGAVVGAHSLVLDDIPAGMVAVGCPARVIRPVAAA